MSDVVKIKIKKIGRKQMPSKFKEGETYNITTVLDEISGRKGAAMGQFADSWKVGDEVDGIWEKKTWKDKDGFEQENWNIKNPVKKEFKGGGGGGSTWAPKKPSIVDAYTVAAVLAPVLFKDKKIKLDDISKLADELMKRFSASTPTTDTSKDTVAEIDLDKEEKAKPAAKPAKKADDDFDVDETTTEKPATSEDDDEEDIF